METPILLLHAFPLDSRMFRNQIGAFGARPVLAPDLRGFGGNAFPGPAPDTIPVEQAADDVEAFLNASGIAKVFAGGASRGGYVLMAFARKYPERLAGAMFFDTRATAAPEKEREHWERFAARVLAEGIGVAPGEMQNRLFGPTALAERKDLVEEVGQMILSQEPQAVAAAARGMAARADSREGLRALNVPAIAIAGAEDGAWEDTRLIAELVPGCEFVSIPGAGHLAPLEASGAVNAAVRRFVEQAEATRLSGRPRL